MRSMSIAFALVVLLVLGLVVPARASTPLSEHNAVDMVRRAFPEIYDQIQGETKVTLLTEDSAIVEFEINPEDRFSEVYSIDRGGPYVRHNRLAVFLIEGHDLVKALLYSATPEGLESAELMVSKGGSFDFRVELGPLPEPPKHVLTAASHDFGSQDVGSLSAYDQPVCLVCAEERVIPGHYTTEWYLEIIGDIITYAGSALCALYTFPSMGWYSSIPGGVCYNVLNRITKWVPESRYCVKWEWQICPITPEWIDPVTEG